MGWVTPCCLLFFVLYSLTNWVALPQLPELAFAQRMREHQSAVAPKEGPATPPASGQLSAQDLADEDSGTFQHAEMQSGMSATESSVAAPQAEPTSRQQEQEQDSMQIEAMLEPREASPQPTTAQSTSPPFAVGANEAAARRSQATKGSPSAKGGHWSGEKRPLLCVCFFLFNIYLIFEHAVDGERRWRLRGLELGVSWV